MTGLEKIVQQILDDATENARVVTEAAKTEADAILEQGQKDAAAQTVALAAQSKAEVAACLAAAKSAAVLATRRAVLTAKQAMISDAIADAQASVRTLSDSDYFALILKMAQKYAQPRDGEIIFSAADLRRLPDGFAAALTKAAGAPLTVSSETRAIDGGFVLVYGGVEENCSVEALFYAAREQLQDQAQAVLFA